MNVQVNGEWAEGAEAPPADLEILRNVEYGNVDGRPLVLDILRPGNLPERPMPVIAAIHGGGWVLGTRDWCLETLLHFAARGYFTAAIGYRFLGEAPFPAMVSDCRCAIRYLRTNAAAHHIDPDRIGLWGFSAGGHIAAFQALSEPLFDSDWTGGWPGTISRVQAVCDWFGPTGPGIETKLYPNGRGDADIDPDPIAHASKDAPPFLIMHGLKDELVPDLCSRELHAALEEAGADSSLVLFAGAGHNLVRYDAHSIMIRFFDKHLKCF